MNCSTVTVGTIWKQPTYLSTDEWIRNVVYSYRILLPRKEMIHATIYMSLENIMLSEISQTQRSKYCVIPPILNIYVFFIRECRLEVIRGWSGR